MFEKRVHRGFLASMKTKQKLGKNSNNWIKKPKTKENQKKKKTFRIKRLKPKTKPGEQSKSKKKTSN
jgi:hypothetical protein